MQFRGLLLLLPALASAADWNPRAAADYLDARQKAWFAWPAANSNAKPCVSCHSGFTYLLARPVLRRLLHEPQPTAYETRLLASLRDRISLRDPAAIDPKHTEPHRSETAGVESIFAAFFLRTPEALDRMWALQTPAGAWPWNSYDLDPWEEPESAYFGAALAALAARDAQSPAAARLRALLARDFDAQPLHNRLMGIWTGAVPAKARATALDQLWRRQSADGAWTLDALGPWKSHPKAEPQSGPSTYATAFAAAVLQKAGLPPSDPHLQRALAWLRAHQSVHGYWYAVSMNHAYEPGTIPAGFMRDAATAWAVLALAGIE